MAVFRVERTRDYTVMCNHHLKDSNLSLKAKGLLSMMLSLPDEWNYTTRGLAAICKEERYPLVEWGITEAQALQACYDRGFDFGGLYEIYHRASCWCCPFQRIDELRKLRKHHPELWKKLLELDRRALAQFGTGPLGQFKQNWSVKRLDTRFAEEDGQTG